MKFLSKLLGRLRPPADPEAEAEKQQSRAERQTIRDRQQALSGARGIPGLAPDRDADDPRH